MCSPIDKWVLAFAGTRIVEEKRNQRVARKNVKSKQTRQSVLHRLLYEYSKKGEARCAVNAIAVFQATACNAFRESEGSEYGGLRNAKIRGRPGRRIVGVG